MTTNLKKEGGNHGLWCVFLVPIAVWSHTTSPDLSLFLLLATITLIPLSAIYNVSKNSQTYVRQSWKQKLKYHFFERQSSKIIRLTRIASKNTPIPARLSATTLEEARRMRQFQKINPSTNLKFVNEPETEEAQTLLSFKPKRYLNW